MATHRTAMGKTIDMDKMRQQNSHVRAVGNMNVNARGDTLDSHNNVVKDSANRVNKMYQNAMQNAGQLPRRVDVAAPQKPAITPDTSPPTASVPPVARVEPIIHAPPAIEEEPEFIDEELELEFGSDDEPVDKPAVEVKEVKETKQSKKK